MGQQERRKMETPLPLIPSPESPFLPILSLCFTVRVWQNPNETAHLVISSPSPLPFLSILPRSLLCSLSLDPSIPPSRPSLRQDAITIVVASQVHMRWRTKLRGCRLVKGQLRGGQLAMVAGCATSVAKAWLPDIAPLSLATPTISLGSQPILVGHIITMVSSI